MRNYEHSHLFSSKEVDKNFFPISRVTPLIWFTHLQSRKRETKVSTTGPGQHQDKYSQQVVIAKLGVAYRP